MSRVITDIIRRNLERSQYVEAAVPSFSLIGQSLKEMAEFAVKQIAEVFLCRQVLLYIMDDTGKQLRLQAFSGTPEDKVLESAFVGKGIIGRVAKTGQPFIAEDAREHLPSSKDSETFLAGPVMLVPLVVSGGKVEGVLVANNYPGDRRFSVADIRLLNAFAQQLSMSLQNLYLLQELSKTHGYVNNIITSMADMLITLSLSRKIESVNKATLDLLGYEQAELIGKEIGFISEDPLLKHNLTERLLSEGAIKAYDTTFITKNNGQIPVGFSASVVRTVKGKETGVVCIARDITRRKQGEAALRESEERFRAIFDNAVDGLLLADPADRTFHGANRMMCMMLGYTPEELNKLRVDDIHPQEALPNVIDQFEKEKRGEITIVRDTPVKRKDGTVFYADISASPMILAGKRYVIGIFRDITERKKAEEALRKLEAEKLIVKKFGELDKIRNEFVETITHELRTPMTPIRSVLEMFLDGTLGDISPQQREYVEMMSRNVERLSRFATDILSLSRLDSGKYSLRPQEMSVFSVIRPAVELLKKKAERKNISLSFIVRTEIFAFADPDAVYEVVTNLVNNAITHCPEGTQVVVSSRSPGDDLVEVSVADNGPGIPEDMLGNIFDRFVQIRRERGPGYKGTGIGLTISKALVEKMGGKISAESERGKGSLFKFTLPTKGSTER